MQLSRTVLKEKGKFYEFYEFCRTTNGDQNQELSLEENNNKTGLTTL